MNKPIKTEAEKLSFSENSYEEYKEILKTVYLTNSNYYNSLKNGNCEEAESKALNIFMTEKNIHSKKIALKMLNDSFKENVTSKMSIEELHELYFKQYSIRLKKMN